MSTEANDLRTERDAAEIEELKARVLALHGLAAEMLSTFREHGHPGYLAVRSCWVEETKVRDWHVTYRGAS